MARPAWAGLAWLPALLLTSSCALVTLRGETEVYYKATVLAGQVLVASGEPVPVVVGAARRAADGRWQLSHRLWLHEAGGYELIVPAGRHTVLAFADRNGNGRPDAGEPIARRDDIVTHDDLGLVTLLDLVLPAPGAAGSAGDGRAERALWQEAAAADRSMPPVPPHSTQVGALADLAAPAFSAEAGREAYWSPLAAFRARGGNIYFAEPYDPRRTPVLFVHGAGGSASDFGAAMAALDRRRYQAWVFQYPSGAALDSMAHLLYWKLLNLQLRLRFERLHLVAHSMGGLVVRRFLLDHGQHFPQIGLFATLSTPWGGEATATLGVNHSPAVVPSWRDLQPDGPFLKALFERPLPPQVAHALLFGHRGGYSLLRPTSDGTITLASQLRDQAQAGAQLVLGFDEDHDSILRAPAVLARLDQLLAAADRPGPPVAGGRVAVQWVGAGPAAEARATPLQAAMHLLVLTPLDSTGPQPAQRQLLLVPAQAPGALGPVPAGRYQASLLASGARSTPQSQVLDVTPGGTATLAVALAPEGMLSGYIGAAGDTLQHPAGSWRPPHAAPQVQRIRLEGAGLKRTLVPRTGGEPDLLGAALQGRDDAVGALFNFLGLPEGDYTLTVEAEGHAPHVSRHRVVPGSSAPQAPIVLQPLQPVQPPGPS